MAGPDHRPPACAASTCTPSTSCPTLYSMLGIEMPDVVKGYTQIPLEGISFDATFHDETATTDKQTQFYSMGGTRAIWHQGWKAAAISPAAPDMWAGYATQRWELFNTDEDPSECHDLAAERAGEAAGADPAVVGAGGPVRSPAAGEPQRRRDPHHRTAPADQAAEPVRVLPGHGRGPGVGRPEHPQPLLHRRGRGHHRHRGGRQGSCSPTAPGSAATPCTSRTASSSTSTTSSATSSRSSSRPSRCRPAT